MPIEQFILTLDAYRERARLTEILSSAEQSSVKPSEGLEALIRALVVLPGRASEGETH